MRGCEPLGTPANEFAATQGSGASLRRRPERGYPLGQERLRAPAEAGATALRCREFIRRGRRCGGRPLALRGPVTHRTHLGEGATKMPKSTEAPPRTDLWLQNLRDER